MKTTLKVLGAIIMVCFVAVCLTLLITGRDSAAPDISDLMPEKQVVPEDQNAFSHLIAAADSIVLPPDLNILIEYIGGKQVYDTLMTELLEKNEPAFALIDKALAFERCQAPGEESRAYIQKWYNIAILLAVRAIHDQQANRLSQSVQATISLLRFDDIINSDAQSLNDFGASIKILQIGLNQAGALARIPSLSEDDLIRLSNALAALKPLDQLLTRGFQFKFLSVANQIDGFRSSKKSVEQTFSDTELLPYILRKTTWFPGYLFKENETKNKLAKLYRDTIQNASLNYADMNIYSLEHYLGLEGSNFLFMVKPNFVGRLFYAFTTPEIDTYLESKCQMEGTRRAAQLIAAIQRFRKKTGKLPDQLTSLCPDYLQSVPLDPFNGQPFKYSQTKAIVYSVGKDLKDSGGSTEVPPDEIYGDDYPKTWIARDGVFQINP